jgi:calcyphosin
MNARRKAICQKAFRKMDTTGDGQIDISDIKSRYNAKNHPDVMTGKRSEDDILYEFLDTFEAHHSLKHANSGVRIITPDEWLEYYNNVSCSIDNDDYFELMITNAYKL